MEFGEEVPFPLGTVWIYLDSCERKSLRVEDGFSHPSEHGEAALRVDVGRIFGSAAVRAFGCNSRSVKIENSFRTIRPVPKGFVPDSSGGLYVVSCVGRRSGKTGVGEIGVGPFPFGRE